MPHFNHLSLDLLLRHDGETWRLTNWRGQYCIIKPDMSNFAHAVALLTRDIAHTLNVIADEVKDETQC